MALLPPGYLKCVVSIDYPDAFGVLQPIGTGFLFSKVIEKIDDTRFEVKSYLVTAKHVIYKNGIDQSSQKKEIFLRFDRLGEETTQSFQLPLYTGANGANFSFPSNEIDVAVIPIQTRVLRDNGIDFVEIIDTETALRSQDYEEVGLCSGDEVFFLGFPLGLRGEVKNYAICRGGLIARLDSESLKQNIIYLDAPVFPGNSGGPVFCKPQFMHIEGTKPIKKAYLLGIVTKFLHREKDENAGLSQGDLAKIEGHLGLAKIITVDAIYLAIDEHERKNIERQ